MSLLLIGKPNFLETPALCFNFDTFITFSRIHIFFPSCFCCFFAFFGYSVVVLCHINLYCSLSLKRCYYTKPLDYAKAYKEKMERRVNSILNTLNKIYVVGFIER